MILFPMEVEFKVNNTIRVFTLSHSQFITTLHIVASYIFTDYDAMTISLNFHRNYGKQVDEFLEFLFEHSNGNITHFSWTKLE